MRSPYETKIILLLKATALAGALAARHECPGARPFPSAPTQRLFLSLATREVLIGGLPAGERDLTGVVIRRQQVLLLAGSMHPVHVPPSVDEVLGPDYTQGGGTGVLRHPHGPRTSLLPKSQLPDSLGRDIGLPGSLFRGALLFLGLLLSSILARFVEGKASHKVTSISFQSSSRLGGSAGGAAFSS